MKDLLLTSWNIFLIAGLFILALIGFYIFMKSLVRGDGIFMTMKNFLKFIFKNMP